MLKNVYILLTEVSPENQRIIRSGSGELTYGVGCIRTPNLPKGLGYSGSVWKSPVGALRAKNFFSEICPFFRLKFFDFFSLPESNSFFLNHFMLHIGCRAGIGDAESKKKFWIFENFYPIWGIFVKITFIAKTPPWELVFVKWAIVPENIGPDNVSRLNGSSALWIWPLGEKFSKFLRPCICQFEVLRAIWSKTLLWKPPLK